MLANAKELSIVSPELAGLRNLFQTMCSKDELRLEWIPGQARDD
jgi:hypothetical protein